MKHNHCSCTDCLAMEPILLRDPRQLLSRARLNIHNMQAWGLLHRLEQEANGVTVYPPRMLPQSSEPKIDPAASTEDVHERGFSFRGAR